jgi:DNA-binding XRE family transcriptional regulator
MDDPLADAITQIAALPTDAIKRIVEAWRRADARLRKSLEAVAYSDDVDPLLPLLRPFAWGWFDPVEAELDAHLDDEEYQAALKKLPPWITESILPDQAFARAWEAMPEEFRKVSTEQEVGGLLREAQPGKPYRLVVGKFKDKKGGVVRVRRACPDCGAEYDESGKRTCGCEDRIERPGPPEEWPDKAGEPARREVASLYARYGGFEKNAPDHLWFLLRFSENKKKARALLLQVLEQRADSCWARRQLLPRGATLKDAEPASGSQTPPSATHDSPIVDRAIADKTIVDGTKLRLLRQQVGMTQEALADKADVDVSTIKRGEAGQKWDLSTFDKIVKALNKAGGGKIEIIAKDLQA